MKFFSLQTLFFGIACMMMLSEPISATRSCKLNLLRSFGMNSRVVPNQRNSLCPKLTYNCCSEADQMKLHKMWKSHGKFSIQGSHKLNRDALDKSKSIFLNKDKLNLPKLIKAYNKKFKPSKAFQKHLKNLLTDWSKKGGIVYKKEYAALKKQLIVMNKDVYNLRKGVLCAVCEWNNHKFINPQSMSVIYSDKFCKKLYSTHKDVLARKYAVIFRYFLLINEILFLLTDREIIEPIEQALYKRYNLQTAACKKKGKPAQCKDLCLNFNLNKFSFMWDGEKMVLDEMLIKYKKLYKGLTSKKPLMHMKYNKKKWTTKTLAAYIKQMSVLSKKVVITTTLKAARKNKYGLQFKNQSPGRFIHKKTKSHTMQIDGMDDELDSFRLYKMAEAPMDVTKFTILIEKHGIDLYKSAKKNNLDTTAQQILGMIHAKGGSTKNLDEVIEEEVKIMVKRLNVVRIGGIINDYNMDFDRVITKKRPPKFRKQNAVMAFLSRIIKRNK